METQATGFVAAGSWLTEYDVHLFNEGSHHRLYEKLGAHVEAVEGRAGVRFAVWAPNAADVRVFGDFNGWKQLGPRLEPRGTSGLWEGFVEGAHAGQRYKFHVVSRLNHYSVDKADPYAFQAEMPPGTASVVYQSSYTWGDDGWMKARTARQRTCDPVSIYELHLGSWMRPDEEAGISFSYRDVAPRIAEYVRRMGFTHVELMPVMEHPYYPSWGYQVTSFFAPTSRYGGPDDFKFLVDTLHEAGIAVILDWTPAHFPSDEHGLVYFDGTHLYEHEDPRLGRHPDWQTEIFNYGRNEVRAFLISSAMYWLDRFHIDGLRVDAVASMLYLDYSRKPGEWVPNRYGGRENVDAIEFLRRFNRAVYTEFPGVQTFAEESTAWPMVTKPDYLGGLGFGYKWDMGWMHDTLYYLAREPVHRTFHHNLITFRQFYAGSENYVLPLSHDEVVHGKSSLLHKMAGDEWQQFANLRALYAYMYSQNAKKLVFMGGEIAQRSEWAHDRSVDWRLTQFEPHAGIQRLLMRLNELYREIPALHEGDCEPWGFEWLDCSDTLQSVIVYARHPKAGYEPTRPATDGGVKVDPTASKGRSVMVALNFTPVPRQNYRMGVVAPGAWTEILNTDANEYGGSGWGNYGEVKSEPVPSHGKEHSLVLTLPPLGGVFLLSPEVAADGERA